MSEVRYSNADAAERAERNERFYKLLLKAATCNSRLKADVNAAGEGNGAPFDKGTPGAIE